MSRIWLHIALFLAACGTTYWFAGPYFSGTLMTILLCHELGHYIVGRRRGVPMSLPYFIPLPPGISLGTMGAVIQMEKPIEDRNALFDVGAAGPIAGLIVAIPLLVIGLSMSPVGPSVPDDSIQGKTSGFGSYEPSSVTIARCELETMSSSSVSAYQSVRDATLSATSST